jgi:hypothetical protein
LAKRLTFRAGNIRLYVGLIRVKRHGYFPLRGTGLNEQKDEQSLYAIEFF